MDNPEKLATRGRKKGKLTAHTTQKTIKMSNMDPPKLEGETRCYRKIRSCCLL
jgi:hypothetical protein